MSPFALAPTRIRARVGFLHGLERCICNVKQELCWVIRPGLLSGLIGSMSGWRLSLGGCQKDSPTASAAYGCHIVTIPVGKLFGLGVGEFGKSLSASIMNSSASPGLCWLQTAKYRAARGLVVQSRSLVGIP